jgi:hypothetical protein
MSPRTKAATAASMVAAVGALILFAHNLADDELGWAVLWLVNAVWWTAVTVKALGGRVSRKDE